MARARNIKPGFFTNEDLVELPFHTRLLFIGLWTLCDREGRMEDRPKRIKMALFPADEIDIDASLNELQKSGFIVRYQHGEGQYIQVLAFDKHQNPHRDERASTIPAPCLHSADTMQEPEQHHGNRADSLIPDSPIPETKTKAKADKPPRPEKPRFDPTAMDLPDEIPRPAWADWIAYRRERKLPMTERTARMQIASLVQWAVQGHRAEQVIHRSIANGWQGLFPPKDGAPKAKQPADFDAIDYGQGVQPL